MRKLRLVMLVMFSLILFDTAMCLAADVDFYTGHEDFPFEKLDLK